MKDIYWFPNTLDELASYQSDVKRKFGYALRFVQNGLRPNTVRTFLGAIHEIREWGADSDYRVYYVANLECHIFVLHTMVKHSTSGVAIPQRDRDLILKRYAEAVETNKMELAEKNKGAE